MMLMIQRTGGCFQPVELRPGQPVRLGRDDDRCHVLLRSRSVSRIHCRVTPKNERRAWLEDLGSTGGTYVNGDRVEAAPIGPGDVIRLGRFRIFVE